MNDISNSADTLHATESLIEAYDLLDQAIARHRLDVRALDLAEKLTDLRVAKVVTRSGSTTDAVTTAYDAEGRQVPISDQTASVAQRIRANDRNWEASLFTTVTGNGDEGGTVTTLRLTPNVEDLDKYRSLAADTARQLAVETAQVLNSRADDLHLGHS